MWTVSVTVGDMWLCEHKFVSRHEVESYIVKMRKRWNNVEFAIVDSEETQIYPYRKTGGEK